MAKYIVCYNCPEKHDIVCNTYDEACEKAQGNFSIYLAPDAGKNWNQNHLTVSCSCFVLYLGNPARAEHKNGYYVLPGYGEKRVPIHETAGWMSMDWFRYYQPDDAAMAWWQEEDESGEWLEYTNPDEV